MSKSDMKLKNRKTGSGNIKYFIIGVAVLLIIGIISGIALMNSNGYAATVGKEKVSKAEFRFYLSLAKADMENKARAAAEEGGTAFDSEAFWKTKIEGEDAVTAAKKKALDAVKAVKVQIIKAKEAGVALDKNELATIDQNIKNYIDENGGKSKADEDLKGYYNINTDQLKPILREDTLVRKFMNKQITEMKIDDAALQSIYEKNADKYKSSRFRNEGQEAVWARHILIRINRPQLGEEATDEEMDQAAAQAEEDAKAKAQEVLDKINAGEDFVALVKEYSEDPGSVNTGGEYLFASGVMDPAFEAAAFALNVDEVSGLVQTTHGFHIIKLVEKVAEGQPISLKGAKEYNEYGPEYAKYISYQGRVEEWKNEYEIIVNEKVYNSIKIN